MEEKKRKEITKFIIEGILPSKFSSTKHNFKQEARKYQINDDGKLTRNGKPVALYDEKDKIFEELHSNSFFLISGTKSPKKN